MPKTLNDDELLTQTETSGVTRLSPRTLERMRVTGRGPRFTKPGGGGRVFYWRSEVEEWIAAGERSSTSDPGADEQREHQK
jgi:hypothetical protein